MLRMSKKLLFAIEAVVDIAYHSSVEPVRSADICRRQGTPKRYLEQVLQHLVHHRILIGQRGPRGGYRLARERRRITVGEIIRVVRDLEGASDPVADGEGSELGQRVLRPIWQEIQDSVMAQFDELTIEALCNRARSEHIVSEAAHVADFSI